MAGLRALAAPAVRWFQSLSRNGKIITAVIALVIIGAVCSGALGAFNGGGTTSPKVTQATATTRGVQPRFGGHVADFTAKFGQPNDHSGNGLVHYARYPNSNIDEIILLPDLTDGTAYSTLVADLTIQAPDAGWSLSTAESTCAAYLPADAKQTGKPVNVAPSGQPNVVGMDVIYHSASLGAEFPPAQFVDPAQNPVASGTFDVFYTYEAPNDSNHIAACRMLPGTQQTTA